MKAETRVSLEREFRDFAASGFAAEFHKQLSNSILAHAEPELREFIRFAFPSRWT
jgi:hypothetical protein